MILDLGLPKIDGLEVARELRRDDMVPILMLTARDAIEARVAGLDAGADDYLVKPFDRQELLARIRALLRRTPPRGSAPLRVGDLSLNPDTHEVHRGERDVELTQREFELLEYLMRNERIVISRQRLLDEVWGYDPFSTTNTIEVFVSNLRRKLEAGRRVAAAAHDPRGGLCSQGLATRSTARCTACRSARGMAMSVAVVAFVILLDLRDRRRADQRAQTALVLQRGGRGERGARRALRLRRRCQTARSRPPIKQVFLNQGAVLRHLGPQRRHHGPVRDGLPRLPTGGTHRIPSDSPVGHRRQRLRGLHVHRPTFGGYLQYAQPFSSVNSQIAGLQLILLLGALIGTGLAFGAGSLVARRAMAPVAQLTAAAGEIERTGDPERTLPAADRRR